MKTLIFLHIPKCAGNSIREILDREYPRSVSHHIRSGDPGPAIEGFKTFPEERKRSIRRLSGHMPFGLHAWMPQECTYITVLRRPVDRVLSLFYFIRRQVVHPLHEVVGRGMDLETFVASDLTPELDNAQVRHLSGDMIPDGAIRDDAAGREALAVAKENLSSSHFAAVGLTERFDESVLLFRKRLGWGMPFYRKQNVTRGRPERHEVSERVLHLIRQRNALDMELYELAERLFRDQVEEARIRPRDLALFRALNRGYDAAATITEPALNVVRAGRRWFRKGRRP